MCWLLLMVEIESLNSYYDDLTLGLILKFEVVMMQGKEERITGFCKGEGFGACRQESDSKRKTQMSHLNW